ncbi:MAG: YraN family protein [Cytophagales bacterium]|nr:YraN family protein [Cytophagales bacterium]
MNTIQQGHQYEQKAREYLLEQGYIIITSNYRYKHCEIDIIARSKEGIIHFIEVKYRKDDRYGYPESFVSTAQQQRINIAAEQFLYENNINNPIVFDIISIDKKGITFLQDAF